MYYTNCLESSMKLYSFEEVLNIIRDKITWNTTIYEENRQYNKIYKDVKENIIKNWIICKRKVQEKFIRWVKFRMKHM